MRFNENKIRNAQPFQWEFSTKTLLGTFDEREEKDINFE